MKNKIDKTKRSFTPTQDYVLVEKKMMNNQTESGIILPDASVVQEPVGTIVAVGVDTKLRTVGEKVLYLKHSGQEFTFPGQSTNECYIILRESNIIGVL